VKVSLRKGIMFLFLVLLAGCVSANTSNTNWVVSPEFETSTGAKMVGKEDKVGIIGMNFEANKPNKYLFHFWGEESEFMGKKLKVIGVKNETGEEIVVVENRGKLGVSEINGANASLPTTMELPATGLWRLDVYLGDSLFDSIIVDVE